MSRKKHLSLSEKLRSTQLLHNAWGQIYGNGLQSDSKSTRIDVNSFKENERRNIDRISRQLREKKFVFKNNKGVTVGKKKRPIVLAPVESRIVQRALLDVLQAESGVQKFLRVEGSYGAIKSFKDSQKGVPAAIKDIAKAINSGATTYYKSDIASFFTQIPRKEVINTIATIVTDQDFLKLLEDATNLEIDNIQALPNQHRKFFDFRTIGTPQGCCLSPLLGNILLYNFDQEMNKNGVRCFRYLDDFIILGTGWKHVRLAFDRARKILESMGLSAYDVNDDSKKAKAGHTASSFEFLGVEFIGSKIRPSKESRYKLLDSIEMMLKSCISQDYSCKATKEQRENSLISTLYTINNKLVGWGNQYYFCNEEAIWGSLDSEVDELLRVYLGKYSAKKNDADQKQRRRMLGIHLVSESKSEPVFLSPKENDS
jgi:RNA-directed DNA polymerase